MLFKCGWLERELFWEIDFVVGVCVCVCEREREKEIARMASDFNLFSHSNFG